MASMTMAQWLMAAGAGCLWLGGQIVWVGGMPRQLRGGEVPSGEPGSERAFMLFWLDQYSYLGITLALAGGALLLWGALR